MGCVIERASYGIIVASDVVVGVRIVFIASIGNPL